MLCLWFDVHLHNKVINVINVWLSTLTQQKIELLGGYSLQKVDLDTA